MSLTHHNAGARAVSQSGESGERERSGLSAEDQCVEPELGVARRPEAVVAACGRERSALAMASDGGHARAQSRDVTPSAARTVDMAVPPSQTGATTVSPARTQSEANGSGRANRRERESEGECENSSANERAVRGCDLKVVTGTDGARAGGWPGSGSAGSGGALRVIRTLLPVEAARRPVGPPTALTTLLHHHGVAAGKWGGAHARCARATTSADTALRRGGLSLTLRPALRPLRALSAKVKRALRDDALGRGLRCGFCQKEGHTVQHCPCTPTPIPDSFTDEQRAFTKRLLALPAVRVDTFEGMSREAARERVQAQAAAWNAGNPWAGSSATRDKLRGAAGWWRAIGADNTILSWILCGARMPAVKPPLPLAFENHPSYDEHVEFVDRELAHAVAEGTFVPIATHDTRIVNPISVEWNKAHTKLRMCVDARWHNAHLPRMRFTLECIETNLADVVRPHDHMLTTDISRAYYSVPIVEEATPYLAVKHRGMLFAPTVLPFGSSHAPFIFNKITRVVVRFARAVRVRVLNFYDDFLWAAEQRDARAQAEWVKWLFPASGWALNDKCKFEPAHTRDFLGFVVRSTHYTVHVTNERVERALALLKAVSERAGGDVPVHTVQSLVGQLVSMRPAVNAVQLWTRDLYRELAVALEHDQRSVQLSARAHREITFWREGLTQRNGRSIVAAAALVEWRVDTSETAVGAHDSSVGAGALGAASASAGAGASASASAGPDSTASAVGAASSARSARGMRSVRTLSVPLPSGLIGTSSTLRELHGVLTVVEAWGALYRGRVIRLCLDSYAATRNLEKGGGPVAALCALTKRVWRACEEHGLTVYPQWVPREENTIADGLSKAWEKWHALSRAAWESVDCMLARAHGRGRQAAIENVPFNHIRNVLHSAEHTGRALCIIHPKWEAQSWWPALAAGRVQYLSLGPVSQALKPLEGKGAALPHKPDWELQASLLVFPARRAGEPDGKSQA